MRVGHLEVFVTDPARARAFYEDVLGFEVETVQQERFVWLRKGETTILLRPLRTAATPPTYQDAASALVLYTDDLAATRNALEQRGLAFRGTDGSPDCLTFTDPDGNWFQLVNPAHG